MHSKYTLACQIQLILLIPCTKIRDFTAVYLKVLIGTAENLKLFGILEIELVDFDVRKVLPVLFTKYFELT